MEANNMKAMREALEFADKQLRMATEDNRYGEDLVYLVGCMRTVAAACRAALASPSRNCDVGTAGEQERRFKEFCDAHWSINNADSECAGCPLTIEGSECEFAWEQMPYKEGENK